MSTTITAKRVVALVAWLFAFHILLAYGLPEGLFVALVLLLGILYWRVGAFGALTISLTLFMATVAYGLALKLTGLEDSIYYRPDEKYLQYDATNNHLIYQRNVHIDMQTPHGDLRSMTKEDIADPRFIKFHTDSDGFRNESDYHGQRYLLVGDSFIAGSGNSQEDMLATQLLRDYGLDTYGLACPGNPADYAAYVRGFTQRHGENVRVLLFLFEGNDFEEGHGRNGNPLARYGRGYYEIFSGLNTYRVTKSLIKRLTRSRAIRQAKGLELFELGGKRMAFYRRYIEVTRQLQPPKTEDFERAIESMQPYIERVYFIPTKYRVYARHLQPAETLPSAQWQYLSSVCRKHQLRCTDLTEPLVRESDALLKQGEFTWWRDDTHWNRRGIAVAARVVAADLAAGKLAPTR